MILRIAQGASEDQELELGARLAREGFEGRYSPDRRRLAVLGNPPAELVDELLTLPAVEAGFEQAGPWPLVHRDFTDGPDAVRVGDISVGPGTLTVIAGPCSVEERHTVFETAREVAAAGASIFRGGAYKPRTSPYSFQGLGVEGLRLLKEAGDSVGLPVVSEIVDGDDVMHFRNSDIDLLQIGARNMQNFALLKKVTRAGKPVLLKRGLSATVNEWLQAAEYLAAGGAPGVILCERGIRTFESATRNTLDLTVLPLLRQLTHLPILVDPSHAAGIASLVMPLAKAAVAVGADGLALEVHPRPAEAWSDGPQALLPREFCRLTGELRVLATIEGRRL